MCFRCGCSALIIVACTLVLFTLIDTKRASIARIKTYHSLKRKLSCLTDDKLVELLRSSEDHRERNFGPPAGTIIIENTNVFFKKILLTDRELAPTSTYSTKNIFGLPINYYRPGSVGFGAWRELICHQRTTEWVLTNKYPAFPLLYHWRILPKNTDTHDKDTINEKAESYGYPEVAARLLELKNARFELVLFLEHIPHTSSEWLTTIQRDQPKSMARTVARMNKLVQQTLTFCTRNGLLQLDPHLENILTDGTSFFVTDFNLAMHANFELSAEEREAFMEHSRYPIYAFTSYLTEYLLNHATTYDSASQKLTMNDNKPLETWIKNILKHSLPTAYTFMNIWQEMLSDSSLTFPPDTELESIIENNAHMLQILRE